ncbi:MAG: hypothetical protein IJ190_01650 [Prevotella sp.]|nr:hypothetical protein [Prevotella sp.]
MRKVIVVTTLLLTMVGSAVAQTVHQGRVKYIRERYAEAKAQVAANGQNGTAPLDATITLSNPEQIDEDFVLDDWTELRFYFSKDRTGPATGNGNAASCYLVIENNTSNGHTRYREILFDSNEGTLLFCYMKGVTDAGFEVETRYYYGEDGQLVDQRHKVGGQDAAPGAHTWNDADSEKAVAKSYLAAFDALMNSGSAAAGEFIGNVKATPKAERMKTIRSAYAQAKQQIEADEKMEDPRYMKVVVHDQTMGPPYTIEMKYNFTQLRQGDEKRNHCYFISEHRHHNMMGMDLYREFLFDTKRVNLMFTYGVSHEEGEKLESRHYFDENNRCIEVIGQEEGESDGSIEKRMAQQYLKIFDLMANPTD